MASPVFFEMGIAAPIKNPYFRYGMEFGTTFDTPATAGANSFTIDAPTPFTSFTHLDKLMGTGDKLIFGPSNDADNLKAKEELTISTVENYGAGDAHTVTTSSNSLFDYSVLDQVTGLSSFVPAGWVVMANALINTNDIFFKRLYTFPEDNFGATIKTIDQGVVGDECLKMTIQPRTSVDQMHYGIWHNIDSDDIIANTYYRMGIFARLKWTGTFPGGAHAFGMVALDEDTDFEGTKSSSPLMTSDMAFQSAGDVINWTEYTSSAFEISSITNNFCRISIGLGLATSPAGFVPNLKVHCQLPFLEHCKGTSADTSDLPTGQTNRAVYTFTELPVLGSVQFTKEEFETDVKLIDGSIKTFNPTGRRTPRWLMQCNFENVDIGFFQDLSILLGHQRAGRRLIFHTKETVGANPSSLPPIMIGKIYIDRVRQNLWDRTKLSFAFKFSETE